MKTINEKQKEKEQNQEITLNVTGLAQSQEQTNGFMVIVGIKKGSGLFNYLIGSREEAEILGEKMKAQAKEYIKDKIFVEITALKVKKCSHPYCNNLCDNNDLYCLRCDDLMFDAEQDRISELNDFEREIEVYN
jgi:hypothetical protein